MKAVPSANEEDLHLLRSTPQQLIVKYQGTVGIIVRKYVASGMFHPSEYNDIVQSVVESVLLKIPAMQSQYNGSALFVTYFSCIVRNICLKIHKSAKRTAHTVAIDQKLPANGGPMGDGSLVDEFIHRFETILTLFRLQCPKVLLCLKLHYRIPLNIDDIRAWYPNCSTQDSAMLLKAFGHHYEKMPDNEVFRLLTPVMNKHESKNNGPDALRKFIRGLTGEILELLNGNPPKRSFDEDSLRILVENHFFPFLRKT